MGEIIEWQRRANDYRDTILSYLMPLIYAMAMRSRIAGYTAADLLSGFTYYAINCIEGHAPSHPVAIVIRVRSALLGRRSQLILNAKGYLREHAGEFDAGFMGGGSMADIRHDERSIMDTMPTPYLDEALRILDPSRRDLPADPGSRGRYS